MEGIYVASGSMEPTLDVGMHYFVNRWIYRWHAPQRGDIIVFPSPVEPDLGLIKRVIAVGGDKVEIRNKQVIVNDQPLVEPYVIHKRPNERLQGDDIGPLQVPMGYVFVLGDNRDQSEDSSVWHDASGKPVYFVPDASISGRLIRP